MNLDLKGKVALVTGASKGLGKAIAEEFANEGADISICARNAQELEEVATTVRRSGVRAVAIPADVTKPSDVEKVINQTISQLGSIDILVNNAGDGWAMHTLDTTDEELPRRKLDERCPLYAWGRATDAQARRWPDHKHLNVKCEDATERALERLLCR